MKADTPCCTGLSEGQGRCQSVLAVPFEGPGLDAGIKTDNPRMKRETLIPRTCLRVCSTGQCVALALGVAIAKTKVCIDQNSESNFVAKFAIAHSCVPGRATTQLLCLFNAGCSFPQLGFAVEQLYRL